MTLSIKNTRCLHGAILNSRFLTRLLTSGEKDIKRVSMLKDTSSTACEMTMLVLSISVTCMQSDLFDRGIFNYEIMAATLANTFLFILLASVSVNQRN